MEWPRSKGILESARFKLGVNLFHKMYYRDAKNILGRLGEMGVAKARFFLGLIARLDACDPSSGAAVAAFNEFSRGDSANDPEATLELALCYGRGFGCEANSERAFQFALKAADSGLTRAAAVVARCSMLGLGCEKNITIARLHLETAVKDGIPELQCALGRALYLGEGGGREPERATQLYFSAAIGGSDAACLALASIAQSEGRSDDSIEWVGRAGDIVPDSESRDFHMA